MSSSIQLRRQVLSTYRKILRLSQTWTATVPSNTEEEQTYIRDEARTLFRKNKAVSCGVFVDSVCVQPHDVIPYLCRSHV